MRPAARIEKLLLHNFLKNSAAKLNPTQQRASQQLHQLQEAITNSKTPTSSLPIYLLQIRTLEDCLLNNSALPTEAQELQRFLFLKQAASKKLVEAFNSPEMQTESTLQNFYKNLMLAAYDLSCQKKLSLYSKEFVEGYYSYLTQTPITGLTASPTDREAEFIYLIKNQRAAINYWEMLLTELFAQKSAFCEENNPAGKKLQDFVKAVSRLKTPIENSLDSGLEHEKNVVAITTLLDYLDPILKDGDIISGNPNHFSHTEMIKIIKSQILDISAEIKTLVVERQAYQNEEKILAEILILINHAFVGLFKSREAQEIYACLALQEAGFQACLKTAQCPGETFYRFVTEIEINNAHYIVNPELGLLSNGLSFSSPFIHRLTTREISASIRAQVKTWAEQLKNNPIPELKKFAVISERPDLLPIEGFHESEAIIEQRNGLGIHFPTGAALFNLAGRVSGKELQRTNSDVVGIHEIKEGENAYFPEGCIIIAVADGISSGNNTLYSKLAVQMALDPTYLQYAGDEAIKKINLAIEEIQPLQKNTPNQGTTLTRIVISPNAKTSQWQAEISWIGDSPVFCHRIDNQLILENIPQGTNNKTFLSANPTFDAHASEANSSQLHDVGRSRNKNNPNLLIGSLPLQNKQSDIKTRTIFIKPGETLLAGSDTLSTLSVLAIRAQLEQTQREEVETLRAIGIACLWGGDDSGLVLLRLGPVPISQAQQRKDYAENAISFLEQNQNNLPSSKGMLQGQQAILEIPQASSAIGSIASNYQKREDHKDCAGAAYYPPAKSWLGRVFSRRKRYGAIVAAVTDGASSNEFSLIISKVVLKAALAEENIGETGKDFLNRISAAIEKEKNKPSSKLNQGDPKKIGTTLVRAAIYPIAKQDESIAEITWVGDSPAFYYNSQKKELRILTHYENLAHFLVNKKINQYSSANEQSGNTYQQAIIEKGKEPHPSHQNRASSTVCYRQFTADPAINKNLPTKLKKASSFRPITRKVKVKKGDLIILSSDPLEKAQLAEIKKIIEENQTEEEEIVKGLIRLGLIKDTDDTSVAVVRVPGHKTRQPYFKEPPQSGSSKEIGKKRTSQGAISNLKSEERQYLNQLRTANTPSDFLPILQKFIDLPAVQEISYKVAIPFLREVLNITSSFNPNLIALLSVRDKQQFITLLDILWKKEPVFDDQDIKNACQELLIKSKEKLAGTS